MRPSSRLVRPVVPSVLSVAFLLCTPGLAQGDPAADKLAALIANVAQANQRLQNLSAEIQTEQDKAALRSLFELKDLGDASKVDLYFGPKAPPGKEDRWIQTIPGKGWFTYFRIYGPQKPAFDGSWKPGDFEEVK